MKAIRFRPKNVDKILATNTSIVEFNMKTLLKDIAGKVFYYIPKWDESTSNYTGWAMVPKATMSLFNFNEVKAETDFVRLTRKEG